MNKQLKERAGLLESRGTQYRTVSRIVNGVRVKVQEPLKPGYSSAVIDGALQTVKV